MNLLLSLISTCIILSPVSLKWAYSRVRGCFSESTLGEGTYSRGYNQKWRLNRVFKVFSDDIITLRSYSKLYAEGF